MINPLLLPAAKGEMQLSVSAAACGSLSRGCPPQKCCACYKDCTGGSEPLPGTWWFPCSEGLSGKEPALPGAFGASYPPPLEQEQALIPLAFWSSLLYFLAPLVYLSSDAALLIFALVCLLKHFASLSRVCNALTALDPGLCTLASSWW